MNNEPYIPLTQRPQLARIDVALFLRLPVLLLLLFVALPPAVSQTVTQTEDCIETPNGPYILSPGESLTRTMSRKQKHVFQLQLLPKQYVHVVVDQKGIDVVVRLRDPNKLLLVERDTPNGKFGPEAVSVVAVDGGTYYLEICAGKNEPNGNYVLTVDVPRASVAADERRVGVERLLSEAQKSATREARIELLKQALEIWRELGDAREEGYVLCSIGDSYRFLRNFAEAMKYLGEALSRLEEARDPAGQAYVLNLIGAARRDLGKPPEALNEYDRALKLRISISDRWGQAQIYNNIGFLYSKIGEQEPAIANFELALPLWREVGDREMELNTLNNIGKAHLDLGNFSAALQQFQLILDACKETNEPCRLEPFARNSRGIIYDTWGQPNEALNDYNVALKLFRDMNRKDEEATVLNNTGMVLVGIGDASAGLEKFEEALRVPGRSQNSGENVTHSNMGYAQTLLGNYAAALKELKEAELLSADDARFQAFTFLRIGTLHVALSELEQALTAYNQALEIQNRIDDRRGQAMTLDKIGEAYNLMNQPAQALNNYRLAVERWNSVGDQQGEALSLYGIASVERKQNKLEDARDTIVAAINKVESLRTRMTSHRFRLTYFESRQDLYELEIDIRMQIYGANRSRAELEAALYASERARARNLLDILTESRADIRQGVDPELLARERSQRRQLTEKLSSFQTLLIRKASAEQKSAVDREIKNLSYGLDQTQAEIRQRSPRYASLMQPQPLKLAKIQELLDDDTLLLEYALGKERSYVWVITRNDVVPYTLPGQLQIQQAVNSFREALTAWEGQKPGEDTASYIARLRDAPAKYRQTGLELSRMVFTPAAASISKRRLVVLADGPLQYVPFGALLIPNETQLRTSTPVPLIAKHEIVYQPSASALGLIRKIERPVPAKTLAVFADPVFDVNDKRVHNAAREPKTELPVLARDFRRALRDAGDTGSVDGAFRLDRLQYSRNEAEAIVAAATPGSSLKALGFDANRARFLSQDLKQFRMVHLATHGILNTKNPELSGLVFSLVDERGRPEDGFLNLSDIYNLNLPVDMVVLSACRTGVGQAIKGEGLMGLTRGFMHAGAARVVASLWKVDDQATATLMKRFYNYMLQKKMAPAAALRRAQLDLMEAGRDPFFWAGFVLQGEWK